MCVLQHKPPLVIGVQALSSMRHCEKSVMRAESERKACVYDDKASVGCSMVACCRPPMIGVVM